MVYALKTQQNHYCPEHAEDAEIRLDLSDLCLQRETSEQVLLGETP